MQPVEMNELKCVLCDFQYLSGGTTPGVCPKCVYERKGGNAPSFWSGCSGNKPYRAIPQQIPSVPQADGDAGIPEVAQSRGFKEITGPFWEAKVNRSTGRRTDAAGEPKSGTTTLNQQLWERVWDLEAAYAREHAWLNEAAGELGCDLDQVANSVKNVMKKNGDLISRLSF